MRISTGDPASADDLVRFFREHAYLAVKRGSGLVEVQPINALSEQGDRERLVRDLEAWRASRPGTDARLLD